MIARSRTSSCLRGYVSVDGTHLPFWPADSPDLNPIENLLCRLKQIKNQANPSSIREIEESCEKYLKSSDSKKFSEKLHDLQTTSMLVYRG